MRVTFKLSIFLLFSIMSDFAIASSECTKEFNRQGFTLFPGEKLDITITDPSDNGENSRVSNDYVKNLIKKFVRAFANGDVATIKRLTTPEFYRNNFPGSSDAEVRQILLSAPLERRNKLINHIENYSDFTIIPNRAGDYITVYVDNRISKKTCTFGLFNDGNSWRIDKYEY